MKGSSGNKKVEKIPGWKERVEMKALLENNLELHAGKELVTGNLETVFDGPHRGSLNENDSMFRVFLSFFQFLTLILFFRCSSSSRGLE